MAPWYAYAPGVFAVRLLMSAEKTHSRSLAWYRYPTVCGITVTCIPYVLGKNGPWLAVLQGPAASKGLPCRLLSAFPPAQRSPGRFL
jgi:hypothetical protein